MDASLLLGLASCIHCALTLRPVAGGAVESVLDLFRGAEPAHARTIASVRPERPAPPIATCRPAPTFTMKPLRRCGAAP